MVTPRPEDSKDSYKIQREAYEGVDVQKIAKEQGLSEEDLIPTVPEPYVEPEDDDEAEEAEE